MQFRALGLDKGTKDWEQCYLPRIARPPALNWCNCHHINCVFYVELPSVIMAGRTWNIWKNAMLWSFTSRSWRHNAGLRELIRCTCVGCIIMRFLMTQSLCFQWPAYKVRLLLQPGVRDKRCVSEIDFPTLGMRQHFRFITKFKWHYNWQMDR